MNSHFSEHEEQQDDNLADILERASRKLQEEIAPIDNLTHRQAILEQRIRLVDEALKKLSAQQLRLGISDISKTDLHSLLQAANIDFSPTDPEEALRDKAKKLLSSL